MPVMVTVVGVAAFVLSLTFIPALVAIGVRGRVREKENFLVRLAKLLYEPSLRFAIRARWAVAALATAAFALSVVLFFHLGQEFTPTLDEKNIVMEVKRVPSTALAQSQAMQLLIERQISKLQERGLHLGMKLAASLRH